MMKPLGCPGSPHFARFLAIIALRSQRTFRLETRTEAAATVADLTAECLHRAHRLQGGVEDSWFSPRYVES